MVKDLRSISQSSTQARKHASTQVEHASTQVEHASQVPQVGTRVPEVLVPSTTWQNRARIEPR